VVAGNAPEHLFVGRLGRAVGLRGEIEVAVESDAPGRFAVGAVVLLRDGARRLTVRSTRTHRDRTIVAFEGIDDRNAVEALRGAELVIPATDARGLEGAEYWDHDLIGCSVVTTDDIIVGEVVDVLHGGANEVLVIRGRGTEHLVPLVSDFVKSVEPGARITIEPIPGLLE
jgi:16S rRNA processing protein RimM